MDLSGAQIAQFEERGYLLFRELLAADEVAVLQRALPAVFARQGPEIVREEGTEQAPRLVFGAHIYSEPFQRLSLLPRLLNPVKQLLGEEVYLHQSRINPQGFGSGAAWAWHQDYPPWHAIDGMREPNCIMAAVFIDDCTVAKSPLLIVPGSHRHGDLDSQPHEDTIGKEYALQNMHRKDVARLADENGIEPLLGPAGSVCFVHCNIVHGSADNVSPWRRTIMYLIYNAVSNACTGGERDWFHHHRDFTPLQTIADDGLGTLAAQSNEENRQ